ncbi:MAG: potassium/proton antiporter [Bacteroidota bacterium]
MNYSVETIFVIAGILLLISIVSSKLTRRFGIPALLLFLVIGMAAGSEGIGGIPFDDAGLAQRLGVTALVIILFTGGLDTDWKEVRPVILRALSLATVGVAVTTTLVGLFASMMLGIPLAEGLLLGAIVSSTDAAAVLSVLRTQSITLTGRLGPLLELESGSNDPMAVFLTTTLIAVLGGSTMGAGGYIVEFLLEMAVGAALGWLLGRGGVFLIKRIKLEIEGLYPVLALALALLIFGATSFCHGSGFLAVYIAGIVIGNNDIPYKVTLRRFSDGMAWLMQIVMFLTLGLLVYPSHLIAVTGMGLLVTLFLIVVARPAAVFISLAFFRISIRQKALVSWVGLRGAVPIILATFPLMAHLPRSGLFFNLVFFIVFVSVVLQGMALPVVARWLRVGEPTEERPRSPMEFERTEGTEAELLEIDVADGSPTAGSAIRDLPLPKGALIVLINRADEYMVARGTAVIAPADRLLILAPPALHGHIRKNLMAGNSPTKGISSGPPTTPGP